VIETISEALGLGLDVPHWTSGRLWLMRLGHAMLRAEKTPADDWAWLIDHSVQIGQEKCLVILGIRLSRPPPRGQCLRHEDMELIELAPAKSWTRSQVDAALEKAADTAGHVPRVIVDDHGVDLHGGVELFRRRHRQTSEGKASAVEIYDAKHKAACLLRRLLENNPRWQAFTSHLGQSGCAVQQTELAFLTPAAPRPKARFMNLGPPGAGDPAPAACVAGRAGGPGAIETKARLDRRLRRRTDRMVAMPAGDRSGGEPGQHPGHLPRPGQTAQSTVLAT